MQIDATGTAVRGATSKAVLALTLNAFIWGVSWWPLRQLQGHGLHPLWATALVYAIVVACLLVVLPKAWRGFVSHPQLWFLAAASGLTNVGFNWAVTVGDVVRVVLLFYLMPAWSVLVAWAMAISVWCVRSACLHQCLPGIIGPRAGK